KRLSNPPPLPPDPPAPPEADPDHERRRDCLDRCLDRLGRARRNLVLRYYKEDGQSKIGDRKKLAEELGVDRNALRIRVYRIRAKLETCIESCLAAAPT